MSKSLLDKVIESLRLASGHNSSIMVQPEVILWPDPDRQWESVISALQLRMPELLVFGDYHPAQRQGPAIWIKCMVNRQLPGAVWNSDTVPVIYLPSLAKQDLKNITAAGLDLQPIMEYQYTGVTFTQDNGKEWTVLAFLENQEKGLGLKVSSDKATREAAIKALPSMFEDPKAFINKKFVDADFFLALIFPQIIPSILQWFCEGDTMIDGMPISKRESFVNICKTRFDFNPDYKNIKEIIEKFGSQRNAWSLVWQYYANAPRKYPKIQELLRIAKPDDLGNGVFEIPRESWPQVNDQMENELCQALLDLKKEHKLSVSEKLAQLESTHGKRRTWIWSELGQAPLVNALPYLLEMTLHCLKPVSSANLDDIIRYYSSEGYLADQYMRKALSLVRTEKDTAAILQVITIVFKPWLESITNKFQLLLAENPGYSLPYSISDDEEFILFADAFRWELAKELEATMIQCGYSTSLMTVISPLPTVTPTAKPVFSPIAELVSLASECNDFRPQLLSGQDLRTPVFRKALQEKGFHYASVNTEMKPGRKTWMEIGDIDSKGHEEQSAMIRRVDDFFGRIRETVEFAFEAGFKKIRIITDHGWLLLPGGLPKKELPKDLTETRWGRCALMKEGATTDLQYFPWYWNPSIHMAYAPGIHFFRKNEEYAHGGISLQECIIPILTIENKKESEILARIASLKWTNLNCRIETSNAPDGYLIDIRSKYTDASSTVVLSASTKKQIKDDKCSLIVSDECEGQAVWIVLMNSAEMIIDKQMTSVGL